MTVNMVEKQRQTSMGKRRIGYDNVSRNARAAFARMSLNLEEVGRIARLARLELSPDEIGRTGDQLNGILSFIEQLQAVDTSGVVPMAHAMDIVQRLRTDAVTEPDRREAFQAIAPETQAGLYLVPKVIE
jgi:aspartyl-tRNA(Asn)/glutamyl-tRNA(Gln) amidotransferase subunit C